MAVRKITMSWDWPDAPRYVGNPRKAYQWSLVLTLEGLRGSEELVVETDGRLRLEQLYAVVKPHIEEFRQELGPLTRASIRGRGRREP